MLLYAILIVGSVYLVGHWLAGVATAVLILIWRLLRASEGPAVLALATTTQWAQVALGVYYLGLTGRSLTGVEGTDWERMVLLGLGCVLALTLGLWGGSTLVARRMGPLDQGPEAVTGFRMLVIVYFLSVAVTGILQQVAWEYPTIAQAILALSFARLALLFLVFRRLTQPVLRWHLILALIAFEVVLGFSGYFAGFKEPLLLAVMATIEVFEPRKVEHWAAVLVLGALVAIASVMWMGVRTEFRQDFDDEVFASSRSTRLQRMKALSTDWYRQSGERIGEDLDMLVDRVWAIYYPALAVERVPNVLPHTEGRILGSALMHLVTPRALFPNKPDLPSDSEMVRKYSGVMVAGAEQNTSIAFGYAAESYVDFGVPLMFAPSLVFGLFMGAAYQWFLRTIRHRELAVSLVTVIFWLGLYLFERSWIKTLGLSVTLMAYLGGLAFLVDRWLMLRATEGGEHATPLDDPWYGVNR